MSCLKKYYILCFLDFLVNMNFNHLFDFAVFGSYLILTELLQHRMKLLRREIFPVAS